MYKDKRQYYALHCAIISRSIRALTDMSQGDLAEKLDLTRTTISSIENMEKMPRATVLMDLLELAHKCRISFTFKEDELQISFSKHGAYALLDKLDPMRLEKVKESDLPA
jgi:transcriptional regulator with XRE-family HTH domain